MNVIFFSLNFSPDIYILGFPVGSDGKKKKKKICLQCGRPRFDPWVGKIPCRRERNPLQYSCLENPMGGGVHGVAKSWTQLSE